MAVQRQPLARLDAHARLQGHRFGGHIAPLAVRVQDGGAFGRQLHQALDGMARPVEGLGFNQLRDREQHHHHGGFWPLAEQECAGHGNAHQGIDVEVAMAQGDPAFFVGSQAAGRDRQNGKQGRHLVEPAGPMHRFRREGRHARQRQRPPGFGGLRQGFGRGRPFTGQLRREPQGANGIQNMLNDPGLVRDRQHAQDQVELQARHASHAAQFLAQQCFFGGAIHLQDADRGLHAFGTHQGQAERHHRGAGTRPAASRLGLF